MACLYSKTISFEHPKQVLCSDKLFWNLFSCMFFSWMFGGRKQNDAFDWQCLIPTFKHGSGPVMEWAAISRGPLDLMVALHGCEPPNNMRPFYRAGYQWCQCCSLSVSPYSQIIMPQPRTFKSVSWKGFSHTVFTMEVLDISCERMSWQKNSLIFCQHLCQVLPVAKHKMWLHPNKSLYFTQMHICSVSYISRQHYILS